jgi:hypothetical protein
MISSRSNSVSEPRPFRDALQPGGFTISILWLVKRRARTGESENRCVSQTTVDVLSAAIVRSTMIYALMTAVL